MQPGTRATIADSGFGATRGNGQVWLGTAAGIVQSWNGVWSNALIFTVPPGNGTATRLNPNILTMPVGDTHAIQAWIPPATPSPASPGPRAIPTWSASRRTIRRC